MNTLKYKLHRPALLLSILLGLAACSIGPREIGVIEGQVSIGPLVPVMREGEEAPTPVPEVYAAREIVIYKKNGKSEVTRLKIDSTGWYRGELPVGIYLIDINRIGIDSSDNLPRQITIRANSVIRLDIDIDTGIR